MLIRTFLITGNRLLLQGLAAVIASRPERFALVGSAASPKEAEWTLSAAHAQVILLDVDDDRRHFPAFIEQTTARSDARILLLTAQDDDTLPGRAAAVGARGVIDRRTTPELLLRALEKVHEGQLWISRVTTGRVATGNGPNPLSSSLNLLTDRERNVLTAVLQHGGESAKAIASKLHIGESTIRNHLTSIYKKLDVPNRNGLVTYAAEVGLLEWLACASLPAGTHCPAALGTRQRRPSSLIARTPWRSRGLPDASRRETD